MLAARRSLGVLVSLGALAAVVVLAALTASDLASRPRTDDAVLQADLVHVAPEVSGRIVALDVGDNQFVHRGDVLFEVDAEPYRLRVEQTAAQLRELEAELATTVSTVASQGSKAKAAFTQVDTARAQLALARTTHARLEPLGARGFASAEQVDQARTQQRAAELALQQAEQEAVASQQSISSTKPLEASLAAARATLALAQRDLRLTTVRAPCDGRVTGLDVGAGEYAVQGKALFTLIDTEAWYAVGDFRETDLAGLRVGQRATVYALSDPRTPLHGSIVSLGYGVAPDGAEAGGGAGLPRVARSLNWVRIAQRFPVRVRIDNPPPALMRDSASAIVIVER